MKQLLNLLCRSRRQSRGANAGQRLIALLAMTWLAVSTALAQHAPLNYEWDFDSYLSKYTTELIAAGFTKTNNNYYNLSEAVTAQAFDDVAIFKWLSFSCGTGTRFGIKEGDSYIRLFPGDAVGVQVKKGQQVSFFVYSVDTSHPTTFLVDNDGITLEQSTDATRISNEKSAMREITVTAKQTGYVTITNTASASSGRNFMLAKITSSSTTTIAGKTVTTTHGDNVTVVDGTNTTYKNTSTSGDREVTTSWTNEAAPVYGIDFDATFTRDELGRYGELTLLAAGVDPSEGQQAGSWLFRLLRDDTNVNRWFINDDTEAVTVKNGQQYHFSLTVDNEDNTVSYLIYNMADKAVYSGLKTFATTINAESLRYLVPRNNQTYTLSNFNYWVQSGNYATFSAHDVTANVVDLNFEEPILTAYPAGTASSITIKSTNPNVAKVASQWVEGGTVKHDLMFINGGYTYIQAVDKNDESIVYDAYLVRVTAEDAGYEIQNGNTCVLNKTGKLAQRTMNELPGIMVEFGNVNNSENITIFANNNDTDKKVVATTLDADGWRYMLPTRNNDNTHITSWTPVQGTFYTLRPMVDGMLSVAGQRVNSNKTNANGDAQDVVLYDGTTFTPLISDDNYHDLNDVNVELVSGKTYYIFAKVPEDYNAESGWSLFQLHALRFVPDFRYETACYVKTADELNDGFKQDIHYSKSTITYSCKAYGDLEVDFNASTAIINKVTGDGGTIVVTATTAEGFTAHYSVVVPYTTHKWDFRTINSSTADELVTVNPDRSVTYKVREYDAATRMLHYLNKPVLSNNIAVNGDNVLYFAQTAGLVFNAGPKSFGTNVSPEEDETPLETLRAQVENGEIDETTSDYTIALDHALRTMLNYSKDEVETPNVLTTAYNNTITIPNLKKGQYLIMRLNRHSDRSGEYLKITNVTDLEDNVIDKDFRITGITEASGNFDKGAYVLKVAADGDVTIKVNDVSTNGWTDIYDLEVTEVGKYDTEMHLGNGSTDYTLDNSNFMHVGEMGEASPVTIRFGMGSGRNLHPRSEKQVLTVECVQGDLKLGTDGTGAIDANGNFVFTLPSNNKNYNIKVVGGTHGLLKVTQKIYNQDGYIVNMEETYLSVGTVQPQDYPKTWDFTARNMAASPAGSVYNTIKNLDSRTEAGTGDEDKLYGSWLVNGNVKTLATASQVLDGGNYAKAKPLFASGSQLYSVDDEGKAQSIAETEGLGVQLTINNDNTTGVELDGNKLKFAAAGSLLIPEVKDGDYVYIKANKQVTFSGKTGDTAAGNSSAFTAVDDAATGVYGIVASGDLHVVAAVPAGTEVYEIGVTDIAKDINRFGFATESRDRAIDHTLTGDFTSNDVKAYVVSTYNAGTSVATLAPVDVVDAETGLVLYRDNTESAFRAPLFAPACNIASSSIATNYLMPNVTASTITGTDGGYVNYVLTNIASYSTGLSVTDGTKASDIGFYKVSTGVLGANKSYLRLPATIVNAQARGIVFLKMLGLSSDVSTGIVDLSSDDVKSNLYFDLNGRIYTGRPEQQGIYIHEGKKVIIK